MVEVVESRRNGREIPGVSGVPGATESGAPAPESAPPEYIYCPHWESISSYCSLCKMYICQECYITSCYMHEEEVVGLEILTSQALTTYLSCNRKVELAIQTGRKYIMGQSIEGELEVLNRRIDEEYEKLLEDIDHHEADTMRYIRQAPIIDELRETKSIMERESATGLKDLNERFELEIKTMLTAVVDQNPGKVMGYISEEKLKEDEACMDKYAHFLLSQKNFIKQMGELKKVECKVNFQPSLVDSMVQVKGEFLRTLLLYYVEKNSKTMVVHYPDMLEAHQLEIDINKSLPSHTAEVEIEGTFYILGGVQKKNNYSRDFLQIDYKEISGKSDCRVKVLPHMMAAKARHAACGVPGGIVVAGGENKKKFLKSVEKYDFSRCAWEELPSLNQARSDASLLYINKKLYLIGGWNQADLNVIEYLDLNLDLDAHTHIDTHTDRESMRWGSFTPCGPLDSPWLGVRKAGVAHIGEGRVLVFGGIGGGDKDSLSSYRILDIHTHTIGGESPMPNKAKFGGKVVKLAGERVLALGAKPCTMFLYNIPADSWDYLKDTDYLLKYEW